VAKVDEYFFKHWKKEWRNSVWPDGLQGYRRVHLAVGAKQMPGSQSVHLEHIFICEELVSFLTAHSDTLETISMRNCYGGINELAEDGR
jgi:hypothetical protein